MLFSTACNTTKKVATSPSASEGYLMEMVLEENTTYRSTVDTETLVDMKMDQIGQDISQKMNSRSVSNMKVGIDQAGIKPMVTTLDTIDYSADGAPIPEMPDLTSTTIYSHAQNNNVIIDSITGCDAQTAGIIENSMKGLANSFTVVFPKSPMVLGDSVIHVLPFEMEMNGMGSINMDIRTKYVLIKIMDGIADFELTTVVKGDLSMAGGSTPITGEGTGLSRLDIKEKYFIYSESDITQELVMDLMGQKMYNTTKVKTINKTVKIVAE